MRRAIFLVAIFLVFSLGAEAQTTLVVRAPVNNFVCNVDESQEDCANDISWQQYWVDQTALCHQNKGITTQYFQMETSTWTTTIWDFGTFQFTFDGFVTNTYSVYSLTGSGHLAAPCP
jgi:hypothetical protein